VLLACALAFLAAAQGAREATPPRNDPCVTDARNTCGTTGVGYYKVGRYGQRWYGDFRGAVPGVAHSYCIDLRFWYPSPNYRYREDTSGALANKEGEAVSAHNLQLIAYAIARFGQTTDPDEAAAVMLYVHSLMGDGRPGELDPNDVSPKVTTLYARVQRDSEAYHGPYRIDARLSGLLTVGKPVSANVRVLSAAGSPVPGVSVSLAGGPATRTSSTGEAVIVFTPSTTSSRLTIRATGLPSTFPRVFVPSTPTAAPNGQRLVVAATQDMSASLRAAASKREIGVSTRATPGTIAVGQASTDKVSITGASRAWRATVAVRLYGPFSSLGEVRCDGTPAWQGSFVTNGPGTYRTPPLAFARAGWYTYVESVPSDEAHVGVTTPCGAAAESFLVEVVPKLTTAVSAQRVSIGSPLTDLIHVQGLAAPVTIEASLYGPFASKDAIACSGTPVWTGTIVASADGEYETAAYSPSRLGYYTYRERIVAGDLVRRITTTCAEVAETTLVSVHRQPTAPSLKPTAPSLTTVASHEVVRPGSTIFDRIRIRGVRGPVQVELFGPFATRDAIDCSGRPVWTTRIIVRRDGVVVSPRVRVPRAGVYGFRERAVGTGRSQLVTPCAVQVETAVAAPLIITGRGDRPRYVPAAGVGALTPARVRLRSLRIDAPVAPIGIDVVGGVLGVPLQIARTGWWRDGSRPTDASGVVLVAGHVDSAVAGRGAFFRLPQAKLGDLIELVTRAGHTIPYRVTSIKSYRKADLPTSVWSRKGRPRLVLVTCGGPFNRETGHYRDNIVVTALPV
jgi:Sortase domain